MRTNLAFLNIQHNLPRTLVALAGIGVAILLMFMQLGFRGAVENTATTLYDRMDFDLLVRSPGYLHFVEPDGIEVTVLDQLRSHSSVREVKPLQVGLAGWLSSDQKQLRGLMVLGIEPHQPPFRSDQVPADWRQLETEGTLLIDTRSSPQFGPVDGKRFGADDLGRSAEVNSQKFRIAGTFTLGAGLTADGSLVTNLNGFQRISQGMSRGQVSLALVSLNPDADLNKAKHELQLMLTGPGGSKRAEVLSRPEVVGRELNRWINETPIGFIFTLGVLLSLIVGGAIFYMILATDVAKRLPEYATLRAMGYPDRRLAGFVLLQAFYLGMFAFFPALLVSLGGYFLTEWLANIPIAMNTGRVILVFCLTLVMCIASGLLALRKLFQAEPASLF
jgi:putative ABC transport system permease protein